MAQTVLLAFLLATIAISVQASLYYGYGGLYGGGLYGGGLYGLGLGGFYGGLGGYGYGLGGYGYGMGGLYGGLYKPYFGNQRLRIRLFVPVLVKD